MSEPIPEAVPTSADPRSKRPTKKRALTPVSQQSAQLEALFAHPEREVNIPAPPGTLKKRGPAVPEIVANVQGSSAGAGSGEFHVYKASRRREYERVRAMEEETKEEKEKAEWERKQEERRKKDEEKAGKNRRRREKMKARKAKGAKGEDSEDQTDAVNGGGKAEGMLVDENGRGADGVEVHNSEEIGIVIHEDD